MFTPSPYVQGRAALGIALLRVLVGVAFMFHGYPKIVSPTDWMGPDGFLSPGMQALVAVVEFVGGIMLIAGFFTRIAAFFIACDMIGALGLVEIPRGSPFVGVGHTLEPALLYLFTMVLLLLAGPGTLSVDASMWAGRRRARPAPKSAGTVDTVTETKRPETPVA